MDAIMRYGDESNSQDESEEDKPEEATSECLHSSNKTHLHIPVSKPCVEEGTLCSNASKTSDKSTASFNFLGLEASDKKSSNIFNVSSVHSYQKEIRKVRTSCGEVEIPNGDFWSDFTPDCTSMSSSRGADNSGFHQRQTDNVSVHNSFVTNTNSTLLQHPNSFKRLHCNNSGSSHSNERHGKQVRLSNQSEDSSHDSAPDHQLGQVSQRSYSTRNRQIQQTEQPGWSDKGEQTIQKRVMYYIHSKVAPYMNMNPTNKCPGKLQNSWPAHNGAVNRLAWNVPNFSHLLLTCGMDTTVRVWNVWSSHDRCVTTLSNHKKSVKHVEWCQAGRKVLSCSYDRTAQVTDVETAKTIGQYEHMGFVTAGHMHPSNPNLFVTGTENMILKWDMRTPQAPIRCFSYKDKFGQVQDLLFIKHGQEFVSSSDLVSRDSADRSIMIWDLRTGTVLSNQIFQERYMCTRLKLHPNDTTFMAQTHADYVAMFSTTAPYKMDKSKRYEGHKVQGHNIGFDISSDGTLVYSGSADGNIHCYHQHSGRLIRKLCSKGDIITDVACHPVLSSLLASCTWGGHVSLWV